MLRVVIGLPLAVIVVGGIWLRWRYSQTVGLHVDEFTTLWAARRTLEEGVPRMPSGVIYTRGLFSTYITAAFLAVGGESYTVGRLPSIVFGVASIVAILGVGRAGWNRQVGWLAAVGLALLPEAITWSGRARFYSQLLLFALLTIWLAFWALQTDDDRPNDGVVAPSVGRYMLLAAMFVLALFSQEETILLFPLIVLGMVLWGGWRYLLRPPVLTANLICIGAMAMRYGFEIWGQPGYFDTIQEQKPYIAMLHDVAASWQFYSGYLMRNARIVWSIAALLGVGVALVQWIRRRVPLNRLPAEQQATLYFSLHFFGVLIILLTMVGSGWRDSRYILFVLPCWLLIGAVGITWLIDRISMQLAWRWSMTVLVGTGIALFMWPSAVNVLAQDSDRYEDAFHYVLAQRGDDDIVMTPQPPACAWVLGEPCDFYARQRNFQSYVITRDGESVDRWSGAALLNSTDQLEETIKSAPRVWFVTDKDRLTSRYDEDFVRTVVEQFKLVYQQGNSIVLMAEGWHAPPDYDIFSDASTQLEIGPLALTRWERTVAAPGEEMAVMLFWRPTTTIQQQINTSLQLVASDGARITQDDGPPVEGMLYTSEFEEIDLPDSKRLQLPAELADGHYRLELIGYDLVTHDPVAPAVVVDWLQIGQPPVGPANPLSVTWADGIVLTSMDSLPPTLVPGEPLTLRLGWTATSSPLADYTAFVHLLGPDAQGEALIAQQDRAPEGGFYPTSRWRLHDEVVETYTLVPPTPLPPGVYRVLVGWYNVATGERLLLADGTDAFEVGRWQVPE